jgi:DNA-binding NarL/FixJ family response regulator
MLTTFDADEMVHRALRAGADGFLLKDTPPERIVESIRAVSRGEPTLSPTVTARLIAAVTEAPDPGGSAARATARRRLEALTAREREVALAIGGGASNADIAGTLFMSVTTVKSHVTSILAKTGAESRLQVAVLVRDAEL